MKQLSELLLFLAGFSMLLPVWKGPSLYGTSLAADDDWIIDIVPSSSHPSGTDDTKTIVRAPPEITVDAQREEEYRKLGSIFFDDEKADKNSTRVLCAKVDESGRKEFLATSLHVFQMCMERLELAQTQVRTFLQQQQQTTCDKPEILLHTVWDGPLRNTVLLSLVSSVYSHGPGCSKLIVHTGSDDVSIHAMEQTLQSYLGSHVSVFKINGPLLMDSILEQYPDLKTEINDINTKFLASLHRKPPTLKAAKYSDLVRILVLAAYGGIYIDTDVLVLNSLAPLFYSGRDSWYRWSSQQYCNSAFLSFHRGSSNMKELVRNVLRQKNFEQAAYSCHCKRMTKSSVGKQVAMLPSSYFDPSWVMFDFWALGEVRRYAGKRYGVQRFGPPFFQGKPEAHPRDRFFPGAFAYHWHKADQVVDFAPNSIADTFWQHFQKVKESGAYL